MAGHKDQIAVCRAFRVPLQILFALHRTSVFINAKQGKIEVVSRKSEVVRIAAEERSLLFGSKDEPNLRVLFVSVQPVLAAFIKRNDIRTKTGFIEALFLNFCLFTLARIERLLFGHAGLHRALNASRYILNRHQHVQFKVGTLDLFGLRFGVEAFLYIILLWRRYFLKLAKGDVVIRNDQSVRTDERTGPAIIEPDTRQTNVVQPLRRRREVVFVLELLQWRIVESPHPLIRGAGPGAGERKHK